MTASQKQAARQRQVRDARGYVVDVRRFADSSLALTPAQAALAANA